MIRGVAAGSDDGSVGLLGQGIYDWVTCLGLLSGQVIVCVSPSDGQNWGLCGPHMLSLGTHPHLGEMFLCSYTAPLFCWWQSWELEVDSGVKWGCRGDAEQNQRALDSGKDCFWKDFLANKHFWGKFIPFHFC